MVHFTKHTASDGKDNQNSRIRLIAIFGELLELQPEETPTL